MKRNLASFWRVWLVALVVCLQACSSPVERIELTGEPDLQKKALNSEFQQIPAGLNMYVLALDLDFAAHSYTGQELLVYLNSESVTVGGIEFSPVSERAPKFWHRRSTDRHEYKG